MLSLEVSKGRAKKWPKYHHFWKLELYIYVYIYTYIYSHYSWEPSSSLILSSLRILHDKGEQWWLWFFFFFFISARLLPSPLALLESAEAFQSSPWAGAFQLSEARVLARIQFLSVKVTVVSSLEGVGKGRQFHALLASRSLYFESVQIISFPTFSIYKT